MSFYAIYIPSKQDNQCSEYGKNKNKKKLTSKKINSVSLHLLSLHFYTNIVRVVVCYHFEIVISYVKLKHSIDNRL